MAFNKPVKNKLMTITEDQETLDLNHSIKDFAIQNSEVTPKSF